MIFQFLNSDVDKWTTKIGILGKSFDSLGHSVKGALFESKVNENSSFWKILLNDLTPEKDDQWLRNSLGEIISQENIDNYIAELDLDSAKDKLKEIFNISDKVKDGTITWDKNFETQKNGNQYIIDTIKNTQDLSKLTGDDLVKANKSAREAAIAHNAALKQQTLGAKAANKALKGLAMVGNMLAVIAVAKGIELAVEAIDKYHVTLEEAQESLEESVDTFKEATESIKDLEDEVVTCTERIEELQNLANQGSISIADEKELELLKKTNDELERKLVLEREQQMNASKKVLKDAKITSTKKVESDFLQSLKTGRFVDVLPYQELLAGIQDYEAAMSFKSKNPEGFESGNYVYDQDRVDKTSERIAEMYDIISPTLEAYRDLIKAGYELGEADKEIYEQLLSAEDAYLLHIYNVRGTEDAYRSLNEEQQRTIIFNRLLDKGLNDAQANSVLNNINSDDLDELWDKDFSFVPPEFSDYDTAEEYGKAYAEAWLKGVASVQTETENTGFLSDDNIEAINNYQSELKQLYEVLNLLHSGVITDSDLDGLMETFPELSNYVDNLGEGIQKLIDDKLSKLKKTYNGLIGEDVLASIAEFSIKQEALDHSINTTASAIDSITSSYQSLNKAIEEYNENGYVSLKTLEEIMKLEPKYLSALMDEEGNIVANTYAYRDLLLIKLKEYELDAYKEANLTQSKLREQYAGDFYNPEYQRAFKESQKDLETKLKFTAGAITNIDELMKGLGSGSSSTDSVLDWVEIKINSITEAIEKLKEIADDPFASWTVRGSSLQKALDKTEALRDSYEKAGQVYLDKANSVGLNSEYAKLIQSGAFKISDIPEDITADEYEKIQEYQKWWDKYQEMVKAEEGVTREINDLTQDNFNQIMSRFDAELSHFENSASMIEAQLANAESRGYMATQQYYEALKGVEEQRLGKLNSELEALTKAFDAAKLNDDSEAWSNLANDIEGVKLEIQEAQNALLDFDNEIRQVDWDMFDFARDQESKLMSEADFMIDLLDSAKLFSDAGEMTAEGLATMGLHAANYNAYLEQSIEYADELAQRQKEIDAGSTDKAVIERYNELLELQQESILAAEAEKDAMIDLVSEGIELQKDAFQDLIDEYTEALDVQKDLYNYQKKNSEQTKKIAQIQKQIAAYSGDQSEEARAKVQQLKVELDEEQGNLESDQYDRYISDQKEILNVVFEDYETALDNYLDDTARVITDSISEVNKNASNIGKTLSKEAEKAGYEVSSEMSNIWTKKNGVLATGFNGVKDNVAKNTDILSGYEAETNRLIEAQKSAIVAQLEALNSADSVANQTASGIKNTVDTISSTLTGISGKLDNLDSSSSNSSSDSSTSSSGVNFISKTSSYDKSKLNTEYSIVDALKYEDFDSSVSARANYYSQMGFGDEYANTSEQNIAMLEWFKKYYKGNGYASGGFNLKKQIAWTQENGLEYIIRPSDGAILTPLAQGDSVLTSEASKNLWNMANNPMQFIKDNLTVSIPNVTTANSGGTVENSIQMSISLPGVTNYQEFVTRLQSDKKFEKMIVDVTSSALTGNNSLSKYRHKF